MSEEVDDAQSGGTPRARSPHRLTHPPPFAPPLADEPLTDGDSGDEWALHASHSRKFAEVYSVESSAAQHGSPGASLNLAVPGGNLEDDDLDDELDNEPGGAHHPLGLSHSSSAGVVGVRQRGGDGHEHEKSGVGRYFSRPSLLPRPSLNAGAWKNERVLLEYSGWLVKRGHVRKNWKRRWFALTNGWLRYYRKEGDQGDPCGVVYLDCTLEPSVPDSDRKLFRLVFASNARELLMAAANDADRSGWVDALQRAITHVKGLHSPGYIVEGDNNEPHQPPPPPVPASPEWEQDEAYLKDDLKVAELHELVKKLTLPSGPTALFMCEFLLTYQLFATPAKLLALLRERYNIEPDESWGDDTTQRFVAQMQFPIRLRVLNVVRKWFELCPKDFDAALINDCLAFLDESCDLLDSNSNFSSGLSKAARAIRDTLNRKLLGLAALDEGENEDTPFTTLPSQHESCVLDFSDELIASHLMHAEHALFRRISPGECLRKAWTRADKHVKARGVLGMIGQFNAMCNCVSVQVLMESSLEQQRTVIGRFIGIAEQCRVLNNFNGVKEIVAGLCHPAVARLRRVWQGVPRDRVGKFRKLQQLVAEDDHFSALKEALRASQMPCLPYLGMYLQTLNQIDEVNKDHVDGKINFAKCGMVARVIMDINLFQQHAFRADERSPQLFALLQRWSAQEFDDKNLFELSFKIEPRSAVQS